MTLAGLLDAVAADATVARCLESAGTVPALDLAAPPALRGPLVAVLAARTGRTVLAVTATEREGAELADAARSLLGTDRVAEYPAWETLPHERLSPRADTVGRRLAVLRRLAHPDPDPPAGTATGPLAVVVAPIRAVLQPQVAGLGDLEPAAVTTGAAVDLDTLVGRLVELGYTRVDMVERRGELAVRGGIVDVFPPTAEHPLRVEMWGDEVEEIRSFGVADQRSTARAAALWAPPCRELPLTAAVRDRARELAGAQPALADVLGQLADGIAVEGMEALAPALADRMALLVDELPAGSHVVVCEPERVRTRAADLLRTSQEFLEASWAAAASGGTAPVDLAAAAYRSLGEVREHALATGVPWWSLSPFAAGGPLGDGFPLTLTVAARPAESYRGETDRAVADIRAALADRWAVVCVTEGHGPAERLVELLRGDGVPARLVEDLAAEPRPGIAQVSTGCLTGGFLLDGSRLAVLTERDLSGQRSSTREMRRLPSRRRGTVDPLALRPGDYVVHEQHGVGRYLQMVQRTVGGATREYLIVEYARGDRLFVPTDGLEQLTRYVGGEQPTLHRLGGSDWARAKGRARKAVREIAAELIRLYSARMAAPGHAFAPDSPWQRELEDAFAYVETPDQLRTIDEVKADMEAPHPMDRVICGDVGYGKTEIAVRAAFKAVMDGKQVAVLVPTTLLAQQHHSTFTERFAGFPVRVAVVSRFNSPAEQQRALAGLADGSIDVVIGTHRLLTPQTRFKDLGLAVVDEEQRFGVEHKEFLKTLRTSVDVLSMSATPIPRTLEMAITGIREMSTIQTPPEERHPVLTFVGPYDERQVAAAIRRELLRDGQVFYVHNRVESIDKAAARLRGLVPEARIAVAHGQMHEDLLERVMIDFWERAYDVLICTTIVEAGLDVATANTLIVERAEVLGLSQLHQLRGRVGRGRERAYAYFLYPPERPLTETAHDRLVTVAQNADLGAGMAVALKDLEIRGAGNLLGGEQSGHIAAVGFDLYVRLVGEAVAEFRGTAEAEAAEVRVDLAVDAHLPHDYVPAERLRLEAYRRIAEAADPQHLEEVRAELADRYGELPVPVRNLLAVATFRILARRHGLTDVATQGNYIRFAPLELRESQVLRLQRLYPRSIVKAATRTVLVPRPGTGRIGGQPLRDLDLLDWCTTLLASVVGEPVSATAAPTGTEGRS
jgi:transcription-repair coupling factor (superfamily II helicase)